jgi:molybdate transport system regulatory protein
MITVRFRVDVSPACAIGPGKIALLMGVERTGSLRRAAQELGMSYRRAWLLIDGLNRSFTEAVTTASVGGKGGGGVKLTPLGEELVRRYNSLAKRFDQIAQREFESVAAGPARQVPTVAVVPRKKVVRRAAGVGSTRQR